MSTRTILKERKRAFEFLAKKFPEKQSYKYAIDEIEFIFKKLKEEYDSREKEITTHN